MWFRRSWRTRNCMRGCLWATWKNSSKIENTNICCNILFLNLDVKMECLLSFLQFWWQQIHKHLAIHVLSNTTYLDGTWIKAQSLKNYLKILSDQKWQKTLRSPPWAQIVIINIDLMSTLRLVMLVCSSSNFNPLNPTGWYSGLRKEGAKNPTGWYTGICYGVSKTRRECKPANVRSIINCFVYTWRYQATLRSQVESSSLFSFGITCNLLRGFCTRCTILRRKYGRDIQCMWRYRYSLDVMDNEEDL